MKFIKINLLVLAVASFTVSAFAQGVDAYGGFRTLTVDAPRQITGTTLTLTTNSAVDIHGFDGIAKIDFFCGLPAGGATPTVNIQGSADLTNWTTLSSVSYATAATVIITNTMYGSTNTLTATDVFNIGGVVTIPTASSAGWSTPYIVPAPFTNSASALSLTTNAVTTIGFNINDAQRYLRLIYSATATTNTVGGILTGRKVNVP